MSMAIRLSSNIFILLSLWNLDTYILFLIFPLIFLHNLQEVQYEETYIFQALFHILEFKSRFNLILLFV
mgnify:CR=1 FL=1